MSQALGIKAADSAEKVLKSARPLRIIHRVKVRVGGIAQLFGNKAAASSLVGKSSTKDFEQRFAAHTQYTVSAAYLPRLRNFEMAD